MGNIPWFEMVWNPFVFPCLQQHDSVVPAWHFISIAAGIHPWDDMGWLLTPFWWRQLRQLDKKVDLVQLMQSLNWVPYFQAFWIILMDSSETTILERPISSETLKPHFGESHPTWESEISDMLVTSDKSPVMWWIFQFCSATPPVGCLVIWGAVPQREDNTRGATRRVWGKAVALCTILVFMCWFYELYSGMSKKLEFPEWSASQPTSWPKKLRIQYIYQACSNHL